MLFVTVCSFVWCNVATTKSVGHQWILCTVHSPIPCESARTAVNPKNTNTSDISDISRIPAPSSTTNTSGNSQKYCLWSNHVVPKLQMKRRGAITIRNEQNVRLGLLTIEVIRISQALDKFQFDLEAQLLLVFGFGHAGHVVPGLFEGFVVAVEHTLCSHFCCYLSERCCQMSFLCNRVKIAVNQNR